MKAIQCIKTFFERDDELSPGGGREVKTSELMELRKADQAGYNEVVKLCAVALGVELE